MIIILIYYLPYTMYFYFQIEIDIEPTDKVRNSDLFTTTFFAVFPRNLCLKYALQVTIARLCTGPNPDFSISFHPF